ncbi:RSP_2647 family RNA methyltransferase [Jannaschia seohaensis]|uniref:23S rRNA (Cytosine1962-C5)-methyltransferase n=1 Tax=Jannaschia seohaensis TaxID=475081 RepID=A0A2Y9AC68_9RHOB|nr:class I SAM-dependent rRNA methyltransferase [Jannaschia seohaensis]PWJ21341.1 23S rRNA (cytosine1962-C5)-methyltransferase [Jannaschia seohaensis]SSA41880.1 23S rRNA (cytosine1962-C5)-methyltransferase [Jannaschia seohaensis]
MTDLPSLRLRPKADAQRIRHGHPWAYLDDVVADRRSRALAPGSLAVLEDAERSPLGLAAVNMGSRIAARMLDRDPAAIIDARWIETRLRVAAQLRDRLYDAPFYRLIHAEADGLPGVVIDRFGDIAVLQPNAAWADLRADDFATALQALGLRHVLLNASGRARTSEGLDDASRWLAGGVDAPVEVPMNGAIYLADLTGGQKTGLFYDQRPNHAFVARLAEGARVLDVFSHVGGFALAALAAGATEATAIDGSAPALDLALGGARAMGRSLITRKGDAFAQMAALAEDGETYDLVVADPPAFAPAKPALTAGLRAYERVAKLAAPLVAPGGTLTLCSCSHAAELTKFRAACIRGIGRAGRQAQLIRTGFAGPDHPVHPQLAESGYLKALTFRLLP